MNTTWNVAQRLFHTYYSAVAVRLASKLRITYFENDFHIVHVFSDGSGLAEDKMTNAVSIYQED